MVAKTIFENLEETNLFSLAFQLLGHFAKRKSRLGLLNLPYASLYKHFNIVIKTIRRATIIKKSCFQAKTVKALNSFCFKDAFSDLKL